MADDFKKRRKVIPNNLKKLNSHINFKLEGSKSNARKRDTTIYCCSCGKKTVLPFKPRDPKVYCDDCFKMKNKRKEYF